MPCGALISFPLDLPAAELGRLHGLLSGEEQSRAARFQFPLHRDRFIAAHGRLRELLAAQLGTAPAALQFDAAEHGKPHLSGPQAESGLQFNLSHSGNRGLVGWTDGRHLGVDIELWRPLSDERALVRRYFSPAENDAYEALAPAGRTRGFFECWTRKEAYVKAVGRGLGLPLDSFDVAFGAGREPALLRASTHAGNARHYALAAPQVPDGVSIAVFLEGESCQVL